MTHAPGHKLANVGHYPTIRLPKPLLAEMKAESTRIDRSLSWIIQRLWRIGKAQIRAMPAADGGAR